MVVEVEVVVMGIMEDAGMNVVVVGVVGEAVVVSIHSAGKSITSFHNKN